MSRHVNSISGRLSLRTPQRKSLEILHRVMEIAQPHKNGDVSDALSVIRSEFSEGWPPPRRPDLGSDAARAGNSEGAMPAQRLRSWELSRGYRCLALEGIRESNHDRIK